jgi:hypothetical protein
MESNWSLVVYDFSDSGPSRNRFKLYSVGNPIEIDCEKIKNIFFSDVIHHTDIWRSDFDNEPYDYIIWFNCEVTAALLTLAAT